MRPSFLAASIPTAVAAAAVAVAAASCGGSPPPLPADPVQPAARGSAEAAATAERAPAEPIEPADPAPGLPAFHAETLAPGIHALIYPETNGAVVSGNSLVVIGDDAALVVDSGHFPTRTAQMIAQIRRWTDKPVRWLINTHWHPDHNAGNGAFRRAFPDLEILSTEATRDDIVNLIPHKELTPAQIDGFLAETRAGVGADGAPFSPESRRYHDRVAAELTAFLPELRAADHAAPTETFHDARTIDLGHRTVRVVFLGRGNTAGDAVIHVPDARLVATGDLVVYPVPYPFGSFISEWIATLHRLRALDAAILVPGHGPVMRDARYLDLTIDLLEATKAQVDAAVAAGRSVDDAVAGIRLDAIRARFVGDQPDRGFFFDQGYLPTAVRRAYREAKAGPLQDQD